MHQVPTNTVRAYNLNAMLHTWDSMRFLLYKFLSLLTASYKFCCCFSFVSDSAIFFLKSKICISLTFTSSICCNTWKYTIVNDVDLNKVNERKVVEVKYWIPLMKLIMKWKEMLLHWFMNTYTGQLGTWYFALLVNLFEWNRFNLDLKHNLYFSRKIWINWKVIKISSHNGEK